jgi:hypothetical protein
MPSMTSNTQTPRDHTVRRTLGIISLSGYLIAFAVMSAGTIVLVLPGAPERSWLGSVSDEGRYLLLVVAGGALGGVLHALTSLADYVGNQRLVSSWGLWYVSRVFVGSSLAMILYLVIRAGLLAPAADVRVINVFGVVALSVLVGMFSKAALDKINSVADVLFRGEKPLHEGIEQISAALGVSTLDNYRGFVCLSFEDEKGVTVGFSEDKVPLLEAERFYDLVLWFQSQHPVTGAFEEIDISDGLDVSKTQFSVAPSSDSFTLRPHSATMTVDVKETSPKQKFKFLSPKTDDPYELWVEISQKNQLVHVASLTFVVRHSQTNSPQSDTNGVAQE